MIKTIKELLINPYVMYTALFLSQIGFSYFRGWNIRSLSKDNRWGARASWLLYGMCHIVGISIGVKSAIDLDFLGIFIWFSSSMLGQELTMLKKKKDLK